MIRLPMVQPQCRDTSRRNVHLFLSTCSLEKHLKKEGPPLIFTDADGKPLDAKTTPSATYSLTLKKIPLENENKNNK